MSLQRLSTRLFSASTLNSRCLVPTLRSPILQSRSFSLSSSILSTTSTPLASIPLPLKGLKVVDLTRVLAGPYCTMLLADLGADVIKIEHPKGGDDTRSWSPPFAPNQPQLKAPEGKQDYWNDLPPESAYFLSVNRNKRSITVDLKSQKGKEIVHQLVKKADVLVENYLPGLVLRSLLWEERSNVTD